MKRMSKMTRALFGGLMFLLVSILVGRAAAQPDYTAWVDLGIVYSAPSGGDAYYPSVIYDANGFGTGSPIYKMWYSDGAGNVFVVTSSNGSSWGTPTSVTGLGGDAHHVQAVYDASCFGTTLCDSSAAKYKIWYWDIDAQLYSICAMATAESADGVTWTGDTTLAQSTTSPLVTGDCSTDGGTGWNRGSYGPVDVIYQPGASNSGTDPWSYSYVMYYDGTDGSSEVTGLAYSADGLTWTAYSSTPVLDKSTGNAWDCDDAVYGTVYQDDNGYHFWYSGGGGDNGSGSCAAGDPVHEGIGYASSSDGKSWTKDATNPIFHIDDAVSYRNKRVYTPAVVDDGSGTLKMYYSAQATSGPKEIGWATLSLDSDGDGVPDNQDVCLDSDLSSTVVIDGCETGVTNQLDEDGCTITDIIVECAESASNHGQFVSCVADLTDELKKAGTITGKEKGAIQSCAAQANIPWQEGG